MKYTRKGFSSFIFLFLVLLTFSCKSDKNQLDEVNPLLLNCWTHSYEEQSSDSLEVYRLCDAMEFTPSFYRRYFSVMEDNVCTYWVLHPADAHYEATGTWEYNSETNTIMMSSASNEFSFKFEIIELEEDLLVLKPLPE